MDTLTRPVNQKEREAGTPLLPMNRKILQNVPQKLLCLGVLFGLGFLLGLMPSFDHGFAKEADKEEVAARVNGMAITHEAVKRAASVLPVPEAGEPQEKQEAFTRRNQQQALEDLITEELLYQEAVARGIKIEEDKVYDVIKQMKESMPKGEFTKLAFAHWTVKGEILKTIERDLMVKKLYQSEVLDKAAVSEEEMHEFYKENPEYFQSGPEVRLQQILLFVEPIEPAPGDAAKVAGDAEQEAEPADAAEEIKQQRAAAAHHIHRMALLASRADQIAELAREEGEDFAALAREYSQGPAREQGGDLGWRSVDHLPPELKDAVEPAEAGTVLGPIRVSGGVIIAKVVEKRPSRLLSFDEARPHFSQMLGKKKLRETRDAFLSGLRAKAKIEILMK